MAVRQLGWSPNQAARSLALRRTDSITSPFLLDSRESNRVTG